MSRLSSFVSFHDLKWLSSLTRFFLFIYLFIVFFFYFLLIANKTEENSHLSDYSCTPQPKATTFISTCTATTAHGISDDVVTLIVYSYHVPGEIMWPAG